MTVKLCEIYTEVLILLTEMLNSSLSSILTIKVLKGVLHYFFKDRQIS